MAKTETMALCVTMNMQRMKANKREKWPAGSDWDEMCLFQLSDTTTALSKYTTVVMEKLDDGRLSPEMDYVYSMRFWENYENF